MRNTASHDFSKERQQTITISDSSDESEVDWEQVGLDATQPVSRETPEQGEEIMDVSIEVGEQSIPKRAQAARRKPATTAEKLVRLAVHKTHLLFLLFHVHIRSAWCNNRAVEVGPTSCLIVSIWLRV